MDRRSVLALCGTALATVSGCGGATDGTETATGTAGETDATATGGASPLAVESVEAPETVEIGQSYAVRFAVENPADGERTLESPVSVRVNDEWRSFGAVSTPVPPGTTTVSRDLAAPRYLGTYRFRLDDPVAEWRIGATERRLAFGESFTTPQGLLLTVRGDQFADSYAEASNRTVTPPDDSKFAQVRVEVRNPTDAAADLPPYGTFTVRADGETYDVALGDPGRRLAVEPDDRVQVELPFVVPDAVAASDLVVRWAPTYRIGETVVVWRAA